MCSLSQLCVGRQEGIFSFICVWRQMWNSGNLFSDRVVEIQGISYGDTDMEFQAIAFGESDLEFQFVVFFGL